MLNVKFDKSELVVIFVALIVTIASGVLVFGPSTALGSDSPIEVVQTQ